MEYAVPPIAGEDVKDPYVLETGGPVLGTSTGRGGLDKLDRRAGSTDGQARPTGRLDRRAGSTDGYATTWVTGWEESAGRSSDDGGRPRATSSAPRAATMAPLSVHRPGLGTRTRIPLALGPLGRHRPEPGVRRDAAADQDVVDALVGRGIDGLADQDVADRLLEARRDIGDVDGDAVALLGLDPARDRGLEPGEREVEAVPLEVAPRGEPAREVDRDVAVARGPVDVGAAREGQAEQPRHLVERLPRRVVDRGPHRRDADGHVLDPQQAGVATADQQRQARLGQRRRARAGRRPRGRRGG